MYTRTLKSDPCGLVGLGKVRFDKLWEFSVTWRFIRKGIKQLRTCCYRNKINNNMAGPDMKPQR